MLQSELEITLIHKAATEENYDFVIFQKDLNVPAEQGAIAWKVVTNLMVSGTHIFETGRLEVAVINSGNVTPLVRGIAGQKYRAYDLNAGIALRLDEQGPNPSVMEIENDCATLTFTAAIYRGGAGLAVVPDVAPGNTAVFNLESSLYIIALRAISPGSPLSEAVVGRATQLPLDDALSAEVIITGGAVKAGQRHPFQYELKNVVGA